ncbi:helix-turn-helix domain-containing protein [Ruegeria sp. HKCCA4008]|uniref:helix-turn-helix domain-containing protein n=1 Tax=Ruegeria sp. HKCCA4008 TaxID=2682999 RepID=UPI0014885105|nr:helix-turn-helix transcriptional regulator [Ruegeria sp. HKCCA4008]
MERYQPHLGELIRELRAEKGFSSQEELADHAKIDARTVGSVESGKRIQEAKLAAISASLKTTIGELKSQAIARQNSQRDHHARINKERGAEPEENDESSFSTVSRDLDKVDADVRRIFGPLTAPTREDGITEFSSRRLISSMSALGIPPEVIFRILGRLPLTLRRYVSDDGVLSTNHIRSAVALLISKLDLEDVNETDVFRFRSEAASRGRTARQNDALILDEIKFSWATRYARRYGNPTQIMRVLEENGQTRKLDYAFIKGELIPHVLRRVLGDDFSVEEEQLVNPSVVSEMARTTLEEFRRLGLYTLRYRTALWLTEDLAIHPPHPWVVSEDTRDTTIAYDFERADANLDGLRNTEDAPGFDIKHRFSEVVHHLCSAILATYNGFLGHRHASSIHLLRHWLAIENDNPVLWKSCELRLIDGDLFACRISRQEFSALLKRLDVALMSRRIPPAEELIAKCEQLREFSQRVFSHRAKMRQYNLAMASGSVDVQQYLPDLAREIIFSCFGARKVFELKDRESQEQIGFSATPAFEGTVLEGRPPLCVFIFCNGQGDAASMRRTCDRAIDQLNAHRLAETCVILCARRPSRNLREMVMTAESKLPTTQILRVLHMDEMRAKRREMDSISDFIDSVFSAQE